jgi:hypothetical protein
MTVDKQIVVDEWDLPFGGNPDAGVEVLEDDVVAQTRWSVVHKMIVRIKDKFYETTYKVGATECQDESPWQDNNVIVFNEMEQVEKIVKVWQRVPERNASSTSNG